MDFIRTNLVQGVRSIDDFLVAIMHHVQDDFPVNFRNQTTILSSIDTHLGQCVSYDCCTKKVLIRRIFDGKQTATLVRGRALSKDSGSDIRLTCTHDFLSEKGAEEINYLPGHPSHGSALPSTSVTKKHSC